VLKCDWLSQNQDLKEREDMKKQETLLKRGFIMLLALLLAFSIAGCTSGNNDATSSIIPNAAATDRTGTAAPSAEMTAEPTVSPVATPTVSPDATPIASPAATPTTSPAATPTASPIAAVTASPKATPKAAPVAAKPSTQTQYPLKIKDGTGVELVFNKAPLRVATIAASETETVFAIGAGDKVYGVDDYSNYPEAANTKPKVGDMNTNLEALLATKPDVVFSNTGLQKKVIDKLRELKIKVYASDPKSIDQVIEKIENVGLIMNLQVNAKKVTNTMRAEKKMVVDALKNAPKKKVYLEFDPGYTVGDGEFLSDLITLAGGVNAVSGTNGWFAVDPEAIIKANPDVILYSDISYGTESNYDIIVKRAGWDQITAVKNKQVIALKTDPLVRVGPRITKGLIDMAKAVHPDLVK
jgi:iron complex transport system substrate-binding protein